MYSSRSVCAISLGILLLVSVSSLRAQTQSAVADADALFQAQKWNDAARAYAEIVKSNDTNGQAWLRLGVSLHNAGEYLRAVDAFRKAESLHFQTAGAIFRAARSYAKLGDKDRAFERLNAAVAAGFAQPQVLTGDPDITTLRDDSRFKAALLIAGRNSTPCSSLPEYKQFDFWVGEWVVTSQEQQVATSSIQRIIESCVIYENYFQADGYAGKSFNFYDANLRKWRQTWVDVTGRVSEFSGEYKDGAMRFTGESHLPDGTKVLRHMILFNLGSNKVRQLSELSTDDGKTWTVNYDFIYTRKG